MTQVHNRGLTELICMSKIQFLEFIKPGEHGLLSNPISHTHVIM